MENKRKKLTSKANIILGDAIPSGIEDFLQDEIPTKKNTNKSKIVRLDLRIPLELGEELRQYAFDNRLTKTATVIKALEKLFRS